MENYMINEEYMKYCMEEFLDINHDNYESKLKVFLDKEISSHSYLDNLLIIDLLIELCEEDYREFFKKERRNYTSILCNTLDKDDLANVLNEYREYETDELCEYKGTNISITRCNYCGKPLYKESDCYHINEVGEDYCCEEIKEVNDIYHTCIGKELIKCGYTENDIMFMLGPDENEYSEAIVNDFDSYDLECENGSPMPEIFYTTTDC